MALPKFFVVFYDCCIAWPQYRDVLTVQAPCADHVFVRDQFSNGICNSDRLLLRHVAALHRKRYADRICVLVTYDEKFVKRFAEHEEVLQRRIVFILATKWDSSWANRLEAEKVAAILHRLHEKRGLHH